MKAETKNLWAPVRESTRGKNWIVWTCIGCTRKQARSRFLDRIVPEYHKQHLKGIRFVRVTLSEQ